MFEADNLIELLKFQSIIGVNLTTDFFPGRNFELSESLTKKNEKIENTKEEKEISTIKSSEQKNETITLQSVKNELENINEPEEIILLKRFSNRTVIGDGTENAKILLIGEAPGEEEDLEGIPFCGKSGKMLNLALEKIGLSRERNLYITNTVFWRPLNNRKPEKKEIQLCRPFLDKIIKIINPDIIITAGSISTLEITKTEEAITHLIGVFFEQKINGKNIKIFPIYHPSYLLRNPSSKKILWKNLLTLKKELIKMNLL